MFLFPNNKAIIYYDIGLIIRRIADLFSIEHSKVKSPDQIDEYHNLTIEQAVSTIKSLLQEEIDEFSIASGDSDEAKDWMKLHPALCQSYIDSFEHPFEHFPCVSLTYKGKTRSSFITSAQMKIAWLPKSTMLPRLLAHCSRS